MDLNKKTKPELIEEIRRLQGSPRERNFPGISVINKYEKLINDSKEEYKFFFDKNPLPMWVFNKESLKFISVNEAALTHYGYSQEEFLSMTLLDILHKDEKTKVLSNRVKDKKTKVKDINKKGVWKQLKKDGSEIKVEVFIVNTKKGKEETCLTLIKDVTEQLKAQKSLEQSRGDYKNLIEFMPDGIFIHNDQGEMVFANPAALKMSGIKSLEELKNKHVFQYILPEYIPLIQKQRKKLEKGESPSQVKIRAQMPNEIIREIELTPVPFQYEGKNATLAVCHDVTLHRDLERAQLKSQIAEESNKKLQREMGIRKKITDELRISEQKITNSLKEKEVLLKEVHHRVKNNLQVISSILNLQTAYIKDKNTLNILKESQNRIKTMAFIHESLYQTKDFSSIKFSEYVEKLAKNIIYSYSLPSKKIGLKLDVNNVFLTLDQAISCGLIINELASNTLKHGFPTSSEGDELYIGLTDDKGSLTIEVKDNGIGFPKELNFRNTETLGLQLVMTLVEQISGTIKLDITTGTQFLVKFKRKE